MKQVELQRCLYCTDLNKCHIMIVILLLVNHIVPSVSTSYISIYFIYLFIYLFIYIFNHDVQHLDTTSFHIMVGLVVSVVSLSKT